MTLLFQNHSWQSSKQLLLLLFMILFLQKCSGRRVFVEIDPSYRQDFMDSPAKHAPSPALSYHMQPKTHGPPSARYTVIITVTLVLLLVCALGMHFMIKCALKCSARRRRRRESMAETAALKEIKESKIEIGLLPVAVYCKLPWRPAAAAAKPVSPSAASSSMPWDSQCAICLSEFRNGEKMRVLPHCSHGFHVVCIDAWLSAHSSCPTCRFDLNTMKGLRSDKIENPNLSTWPTNPLFEW